MKKLTNRLAQYLMAIFIILAISAILIPITIYLHKSKNTEILAFYKNDKIANYCQLNKNENFQECLRKDINLISTNFSPNDTFYILKTLDDVLRIDLANSKDPTEKQSAFLNYYENLIIFLTNQHNIVINRNDFSFYSMPMIPVASLTTQIYLKKISKDVKENLEHKKPKDDNSHTYRIKRVMSFFDRLKFNIIKKD